MSKRKPLDKEEARARRDRLLHAAAEAELDLTDAVREMRSITGMTQEEFARHRGVSARVIKAIELGKGNPTVATLNRIGELFGLEVSFVPKRRLYPTDEPLASSVNTSIDAAMRHDPAIAYGQEAMASLTQYLKEVEELQRTIKDKLHTFVHQIERVNSDMHDNDARTPEQRQQPAADKAARIRKKSAP